MFQMWLFSRYLALALYFVLYYLLFCVGVSALQVERHHFVPRRTLILRVPLLNHVVIFLLSYFCITTPHDIGQ